MPRIGSTSVVRERLIPNGSGSGDPDLQEGCGLTAKRMARGTRSPARVASEGPRPTVNGTVFNRSAGACPPRSLHGEGQALALREGAAFFYPSAGPVTATLSDL